ncbi:MAG: hypothetical protein LUB59_04055 [Candidatus Gastranaerophilales bacterium]|nr:hypothetical protein [Candidatus Gastranaerophilales bacterium]
MLSVQSQPVSFQKGEMRQKVKDNSTEITIGGGAGMATFGTLRNSSKIGTSLVQAVKSSKTMKAQKQTQILELIAKFKPLAKYVNNPIVKKSAGVLAGLSAATGLVGSSAKIADTCNFLTAQNPKI